MKNVQSTQLVEALAAILSGTVTKPRKGKKAKRAKMTDAEKAEFIAKNDAECVKAFEAKGFKDVQPRVNVLTYDRWIAQGRRVKKGEKAVKVGPFNLFHVDSTEPLPVGDQTPANKIAA